MNFFDSVRPLFGGRLNQHQVDGMKATIAYYDSLGLDDLDQLAYILATGFHEAKFEPVRENLNYTTAARIRRVWPSRFKTEAAAKPYVRNPQALAEKVYGGRLGNRLPGDGWRYRGGGWPQLTGRENYAKFGLDTNPDAILKPEQSARVLVSGMVLGKFTSKKLSDYVGHGKRDFVNARAVVNDDVKANGEKIAEYAETFRAALDLGLSPADVALDEPAAVPSEPAAVAATPFPWGRILLFFGGIVLLILYAF